MSNLPEYIDAKKSNRKKKKSKVKSEAATKEEDLERIKDLISQSDSKDAIASGSGRNSPALAGSSVRKTEAERRFEEVQKRRVCPIISNITARILNRFIFSSNNA